MKTADKAREVISRVAAGEPVQKVKKLLSTDAAEWGRISAKAYRIWLDEAKKKRSEDLRNSCVVATSNKAIREIISINERLADFALCIPAISNQSDVEMARLLLRHLPGSEAQMLSLIERMAMEPRIRALQNVGRVRHFPAFKGFAGIVEAATLSYYRSNYVSAYLTLVPVIEGAILRWSGFVGIGEKPEFEIIRKFFAHSHVRQPCPANPLFYEVFAKACDRIINDHLYKPSAKGCAHSEFNRHQAAHLLRDAEFATRENCIRLFLLLDTMAELYLYETSCPDPRWSLTDQDVEPEVSIYRSLVAEASSLDAPERVLLDRRKRVAQA